MKNFKLYNYDFHCWLGPRWVSVLEFECKDSDTRALLDIGWTSNRLWWLDILWFRVWG